MSTRFFRLYLKLLRGGVAASFIFSLALVSAAEAKVCFLPQAEDCLKDDAGPNPDECPTGYTAYVSKPNCGIGKKAEQSGMSNGTPCYKCVDETSSDCDRGKLKKDLDCAEGKATEEVGETNGGLKCYECVDDVCPSPYANTEAEAGCNSVTSYPAEVNGTTKLSGEPCYECKTCSKGEHYESKPSDNCHDYTKVDNEPCWTKTFSSYANSDNSCPTGMQLDPCGEGEKQTATDTSNCGKTCYKCEDNQICIKFDLYCNGQKCSSEQISELNEKNGDDPKAFQIKVGPKVLDITEETEFCGKPDEMIGKEYEISSSVDGRRSSWKFENSSKPYVYHPNVYRSERMDDEDNLIFKKADDGYHVVSLWQAHTECASIDNEDDYWECMIQKYDNGTGERLVDNTYTYEIKLRKAGKDKRCIYYKVKCYHLPLPGPTVKIPSFWNQQFDSTSPDRKKVWDDQYEGWSYYDYGNKWAKDCVKISGEISSSGEESRVNQKFPLTQMTEAELSFAAYGGILDNGYDFDENGQIVDAGTGQPVDIPWTDQQKFFQNLADDEVILKSCDFQEWDTVDLKVSPLGPEHVTDDDGQKFFWGGYILNNDQCKNQLKGNYQYSCMSEENISLFSDHQYKTAELYPYVYLTAPVSVQIKEGGFAVLSWKLMISGHSLPTNLKLGANTMVLGTGDGHPLTASGSFGDNGVVYKGAWESYFSYSGNTEFEFSTNYTQKEAEEKVSGNATSVKVVVDDESGNEHDINITEGEPFKANVPNLSEDYEGDNYIYLFGKGIQTN